MDSSSDDRVKLPINEQLLKELNNLYGEKNFKSNIQSEFNIHTSTAFQLYMEILESFKKRQEEELLKQTENDKMIAMMMQEEEENNFIVNESNGHKREKECEWQVVEKQRSAQKCRDKLYIVFLENQKYLDKSKIDEIFDAHNRNFKETVKVLKDSFGFTEEECKKIDEEIAQVSKIYDAACSETPFKKKNFKITSIDLHFFSVSGAKILLNNFLDEHIMQLRKRKNPFIEVDVITGRGARSSNGIPALKQMATELFNERRLRWTSVEINPGLLKVKIKLKTSLLDKELKQKSSDI